MLRFVLPTVAAALFALPALGASPNYPDTSITPGKARAVVTVEQLCGTDWTADDHSVSATMRREIFAEYRLSGESDPVCHSDGAKKCRIDHLIARKLGGANAAVNLWPQRTTGDWSAADKDKLEDCMHARVCAKLAKRGPEIATQLLHLYQHDLVSDWIAAYRNVIGSASAVCSPS